MPRYTWHSLFSFPTVEGLVGLVTWIGLLNSFRSGWSLTESLTHCPFRPLARSPLAGSATFEIVYNGWPISPIHRTFIGSCHAFIFLVSDRLLPKLHCSTCAPSYSHTNTYIQTWNNTSLMVLNLQASELEWVNFSYNLFFNIEAKISKLRINPRLRFWKECYFVCRKFVNTMHLHIFTWT